MTTESAAEPLPLPPANSENEPAPHPLSRRELLIGAGAGAALLATNAVTGAITHNVSTRAAETRAEQQFRATREELEHEIELLKRQLALYDDLERIGVDHLIRGLLETYDRLWPVVQAGAGLLLQGLHTIEEALSGFEGALQGLRRTADAISGLHAGVEAQLDTVRDLINEVLKRTAPIGEAVSGFLSWLLGRIPFGVGDRVREASERLGTLVATVPILTADTRGRLLQPLQQEWLAAGEQSGLQGRLFDPLRKDLLSPLREHLDQVQAMSTHWQDTTSRPLADALNQREQIRRQLTQLRAETRNPGLRHTEG